MIDGLADFGALFRIVLPLSAPGLAAVAIFTFTGAGTSFSWHSC